MRAIIVLFFLISQGTFAKENQEILLKAKFNGRSVETFYFEGRLKILKNKSYIEYKLSSNQKTYSKSFAISNFQTALKTIQNEKEEKKVPSNCLVISEFEYLEKGILKSKTFCEESKTFNGKLNSKRSRVIYLLKNTFK